MVPSSRKLAAASIGALNPFFGRVAVRAFDSSKLTSKHLTAVAGFLAVLVGCVLLVLILRGDAAPKIVSTIEVEGARYLSREEILVMSGLSGHQSLTGADLQRAASLLGAHPAVESATIEFVGAGTVSIRLAERACAAQLRDAADGLLLDVDAQLVVLSRREARCRDVPLISGVFDSTGARLEDPQLLIVMAGIRRIRELYPALYARLSEVRTQRDGTTEIFLSGSRLKLIVADRFDGDVVHRLYAGVAYLERERLRKGSLDLRGRDAVYVP